MGYPTCKTSLVAIGGGAICDIEPPSYQAWRIWAVGSNILCGNIPHQVPCLHVGLCDGTLFSWFMFNGNGRGWYRRQNLVIDALIFMRIANASGFPATISWSAEMIEYSGCSSSVTRSGIESVGAGASASIQPPYYEDWVIYDFGSDKWLGKFPNANPRVDVELVTGDPKALILSATDSRQWNAPLRLVISEEDYLTLTNLALVAASVGWSAKLLRYRGVGYSVVMSDVQTVGAGAGIHFQPDEGDEWAVRMIGSSRWFGGSPAEIPNVNVAYNKGSLIEDNWNNSLNIHDFEIQINHANYLIVTNLSGLGQNVGINAELLQRYVVERS